MAPKPYCVGTRRASAAELYPGKTVAERIRAEIQAERSLGTTPAVTTVPPAYREAAALALRHARARLRLPALPLLWHDALGANEGETWTTAAGSTIHINVAGTTPRRIAWVMLHECQHAADGLGHTGREAEADANAFADAVLQHPDFSALDWRPQSGTAPNQPCTVETVKGHAMNQTTIVANPPTVGCSDPHAARQALLREGHALADRAEREQRGLTDAEQRRAAAILAELSAVSVERQRCSLCGSIRPKWERCQQCGSLGWGYSG